MKQHLHTKRPFDWPINQITRARYGPLLLVSLAVAGAASALMVAVMSLLLHHRVTLDYLTTGGATGLAATLVVAVIVLFLTDTLRRVEAELDDSIKQQQASVKYRPADFKAASKPVEDTGPIITSLDFDEVLLSLARHLRQISGFQYCSIYEWNARQSQARTLAEHGCAIWPIGDEDTYPLSDYPTTVRVLESGKPELVTLDTDQTEAVWMEEIGISAALLIPLTVEGETVGMVEIALTRAEHIPNQAAIERGQRIVAEVGAQLRAPLRANADETLLNLAERLVKVVERSQCAISEWDRDAGTLRSVVEYSNATWQPGSGALHSFPQPILERALQGDFVIDRSRDPSQAKAAPGREGGQTQLLLPLAARGEVIGLVELTEVGVGRWIGEEEIRLWRTIADQAAVAVENANLYHQAQQEIKYRKQMQETLNRERNAFQLIAEVASQTLSLAEVSQGILRALVQATGFERGAIRLYNARYDRLDLISAVGIPEDLVENRLTPRRLSDTSSLPTYVAATREPLFAPDMSQDQLPPQIESSLADLGLGAMLCWPLIDSSGSLIGVMHISDLAPRTFSEHDRQFYGNLVRLLTTVLERKIAEEQVEASLAEKEIMLKEIHHRVKNNLQIISSLLSLQSGYVKDEHANALFIESQTRVRSMALIHEQLYRSADLAYIDFAEYIRELTRFLASSYCSRSNSIQFQITCNEVFLDITTAIPCGLIINELASNALKHAFPNGQTGVIGVEMGVLPNGASENGAGSPTKYRLTVWDNGVGFPEGLDFRNTQSLGLQLVNSLTQQLGGSVELSREGRTAFEIVFAGEDTQGEHTT